MHPCNCSGQREEEGGQTVLCEVQVASHAQKYFIRLNSMNRKDKRRSSIHDITTPAGAAGGHFNVSCCCNVCLAVHKHWLS
jgi:hypothetical protein